jgi:hypothetical protein
MLRFKLFTPKTNVPKPVARSVTVQQSAPSKYLSMKVLMLTQVKSCRSCGRK